MYLIVGLGNPGAKYQNTFHNVGFMCIDFLSQKHNINVSKVKHKAIIGEGEISGEKIILAKPQTYMNLSGESVREIAQWYKIEPKHIIIMYDDINLEIGKLRIREKGSAGGHNGMKSIIYQLNTDEFPRIRVGIGKPGEKDLVDYVLSKVPSSEQDNLFETIKNAVGSVDLIIKGDMQGAMNRFN
jgi:PTH1 family peptidyl-tRNA hydrolase